MAGAEILPFIILPIAIVALVRGAGVLVFGAQNIGLHFGVRPFVVGVFIIGLGTSLPELFSSLAAIFQAQPDIVVANVVGSNITNILLVGGILALLAGPFYIKQDLLRTEVPLFAIALVHFIVMLIDGVIDIIEGILLVASGGAYLWYLWHSRTKEEGDSSEEKSIGIYDAITYLMAGGAITILGAHYTVSSLIFLAEMFMVPISVLSIVAIAVGTSLPELMVSLQAVRKGETDMAIGNLFGSNAFNIFMVAGIPALFVNLPVAAVVSQLGIYILLAASFLFLLHALSRQYMPWEGLLFLLFYAFFLVKIIYFI